MHANTSKTCHKTKFKNSTFATRRLSRPATGIPNSHLGRARLGAGGTMPRYSNKSLQNLGTCHPDLQRIFHEVIKVTDCAVIEGHRNRRRQNMVFRAGSSKLRWPESKHNTVPSLAVDVVPWVPGKGAVWDADQCAFLAGVVKAVAAELNISFRWGGDWNGDGDMKDQTFNDLVHYELIIEE